MITIKSFAKKTNKTTNSGSGSNVAVSTDSKVLDTHLLWGNEFNGTQDVDGSITSKGDITAINGHFSNSVDTKTVTANNGTITNLSGNTATYDIANITNGNIDSIVNNYLEGGEADFSTLSSVNGTITTLNSSNATVGSLSGDSADIDSITSEQVDTTKILADNGIITTISGDTATITNVSGDSATFDLATLKEILSENITTENLTVTKSAHFFELIIDKIKSAGGSVLLTPADGFKVDKVESEKQSEEILTFERETYNKPSREYTEIIAGTVGFPIFEEYGYYGQKDGICGNYNTFTSAAQFSVSVWNNVNIGDTVTFKTSTPIYNASEVGTKIRNYCILKYLEVTKIYTLTITSLNGNNSVTGTINNIEDLTDEDFPYKYRLEFELISDADDKLFQVYPYNSFFINLSSKMSGTTAYLGYIRDCSSTEYKKYSFDFYPILADPRYLNRAGISIYGQYNTGNIPTLRNVKLYFVDEWNNYKLLWQATDGTDERANMWKINDQAICQTFNAAEGTNYDVSNKYYWALVSDTGTETIDETDYHYITLDGSVVDGTLNPEIGDEIAMLGYRGTDDNSRQSALYLAAYNSIDTGVTAPLIAQYEGINDFNLASHRKTWFAANGNEVSGNLKVVTESGTTNVVDLIESEKESILEVTNERITVAVTESKNYTDGKETTLRSYIDTTAANVLLSANNTSKDYTDGVATTLRGEISVSADEITSTVSKKIGGSNIFLFNSSKDGWKTTNTTYPEVFFNEDTELFYTLTQYYDIYSPVLKTTTVAKDYVISLYGAGTYYLYVYGFSEGEDFNTLSNWNSSHQIFNATSINLTLVSGDTYNGLTRRYKSFNTNKKYLGVRITLVTAGNGTTTGSRVAHIQIEEGTTPLAYNTGSSAISSQITQTAEQIIVDVKDLLINGDVTINGLITNVSRHINQQDLEDKDAVVIDFVNNKNITVENILDDVPLQLRNNGQIVYLPFYDTNYNDNLSGYVSQNPVVTASEFGFTKYGLHFEDSAINFTVPVYKTEGTQLRITNSYVPTINNWQNYANIYSNVSDSEKVGLFGQLLRSCVILCADPRLLTYRNFRGYYNSSLDGMIFDTSKGHQTSTTNVIDPSHSGAFLYNGLRSRFIFLLPSQSVNLRSQIINYGNGRKVLNWLVESTSDIKPITAAIAFRYGDNSEYTTYYNEVIGGTSWQTQYTQVNDIMLGHDAINGDKLGTRPVYPIIQITNNTTTNGSVPYVVGYEDMQ